MHIDYVYDITDVDVMNSIFVKALVNKMASDLAMPLTGNTSLFDQAYKLYQAAIQEAKSMSAKERKLDMPYVSGYLKARRW